MHLRGKAMMVEAILPSGQKQVISLVSDFNFNWMTTYVYADDVAPLLPKGTILKVTAWHDNTSAKKSNPDPNQWVGWGDRTVDEMAHAWINIVYISAAPARKQGDGAGPFKKMVIRSVTLIDGTGGPPLSPMDIVIEGNQHHVGAPGRLAGAAAAGRTASRATPTSRSTARACT